MFILPFSKIRAPLYPVIPPPYFSPLFLFTVRLVFVVNQPFTKIVTPLSRLKNSIQNAKRVKPWCGRSYGAGLMRQDFYYPTGYQLHTRPTSRLSQRSPSTCMKKIFSFLQNGEGALYRFVFFASFAHSIRCRRPLCLSLLSSWIRDTGRDARLTVLASGCATSAQIWLIT